VNAASVPAPLAWRLPPADAARMAAEGRHCEARPCREPVTVVTWRKFQSKAAGRELLSERLVCEAHAARFAARYHAEIEDAPRGEQ